MRLLIAVLVALLSALLSSSVSADAPPPNTHSVKYTFSIENLGDFPDHVFLIYPTTNNESAYLVEKGKGVTNLMVTRRKGSPTRLYAMTRRELDKHEGAPRIYPHGDDNAEVRLVSPPLSPPVALKSDTPIEPPDPVPLDSPVTALERVARIQRITEQAFDVVIVRESKR